MRISGTLALSLLLGSPFGCLAGQVAGNVAGADGRLIRGAVVDLYSPNGRIASLETNGTGLYSFPVPPAETLGLLVRHIGNAPVRVAVSASAMRTINVRMTRMPPARPAARLCPLKSSADALRLYGTMVDRYVVIPDTTLRRVSARRLVADVSADSLGLVDTTGLRPMIVGGNSLVFEYGRRPSGTGNPRAARWVYPWLESIAAQHFVEDKFLTWNAVTLGAQSSRGTTLRFCSRISTPEHYLQGELLIGLDASLIQAEFQFISPSDEEDAGGGVYFSPIVTDRPMRIRPVAALFWRKHDRRYYTEWMEFQEWR